MDLLRWAGVHSSHLVGQFLVIAHMEPGFPAVRRAGLQDPVQFLDQVLGQLFIGPVDDQVDASEVVGRFHDIIDIHAFVRDANGIGLKDETRLLVCQPAPLDVVGIVGEVDLGTMIDSTSNLPILLFPKPFQQRRFFDLAFSGQGSIGRDTPSLPHEHGPLHLSGRAPIPDRPFRKVMKLGILADSNEIHIGKNSLVLVTNITKLADIGKF